MSNLKSIIQFFLNYWLLIIVFLGIFYFVFKPEKKELIIVSNFDYEKIEVTKDDSRIKHLWDYGETFIINNSRKTIKIESIEYSTMSVGNYYTPEIIEILPNKTHTSKNDIDYIFKKPPKTISVKSSGYSTRWYLHR